MRPFIGDGINIDGRRIEYQIFTAHCYFQEKMGWSEEEVDQFICTNSEIYERVTQILALKQSCYLLHRTSHSCQSLSDGLYRLKNELINDLRHKHSFDFDDSFVENYNAE